MLKICNLREGILVVLMSIGTLTAEAAVGLENLNDSSKTNAADPSEILDLVSKAEQEIRLASLKSQELKYRSIKSYLLTFQELCESDITEGMCEVPNDVISNFAAGITGIATLSYITSFTINRYTFPVALTEEKAFIQFRDQLRKPLSSAIDKLKRLPYFYEFATISEQDTRIARVINIIDKMDFEIREILKVGKPTTTLSRAMERINRVHGLFKIQRYRLPPNSSSYLNFLNKHIAPIIEVVTSEQGKIHTDRGTFHKNLKELERHGLGTQTRLGTIIHRLSGTLMVGGAAILLMRDDSYLLNSEAVSSQLDEVEYELKEIQDQRVQLENLIDSDL